VCGDVWREKAMRPKARISASRTSRYVYVSHARNARVVPGASESGFCSSLLCFCIFGSLPSPFHIHTNRQIALCRKKVHGDPKLKKKRNKT